MSAVSLSGESPPSPQLFSDACGLQDLIDLAIESSPLLEDPVYSNTKISFKLRSDFYPIAPQGKDLDLFQNFVERALTRLAHNNHGSPMTENLTSSERVALKSLTIYYLLLQMSNLAWMLGWTI